MYFPSLMPKKLDSYLKFSDPDQLIAALIKKTDDLVLFFETASDDETWTENHQDFMRQVLEWLTVQTKNDRISKKIYHQAAKSIQKHHMIMRSIMPKNVIIKLKDAEIPYNGMLLTAASEFFRQLLLTESHRGQTSFLSFPQLTTNDFAPVGSFIESGEVPDLPTTGQDELIALIKRANAWELPLLSLRCEHMLAKYLTDENVFKMIEISQQERWGSFKQACIRFVNQCEWGFNLSAIYIERLGFEFLDFSESTLAFFERLRPLITDVLCHGTLVEDSQFGQLLKGFPGLFSLDISRTQAYSTQLEEMPKGLRVLNLSSSPWISKETIKFIYAFCPDLEQIILQNNVHLNYGFWAELSKFKRLHRLDLSNCTQIQDADLSLILKGVAGLTEISLGKCNKITETGFLELAKKLTRLIKLDVSRSSISGTALVEIGSRCRYLTNLNISYCEALTEKGFSALIKSSLALEEIDIKRCAISESAIEEIKRLYPMLILISQ